jgi:hypothetical protein
MAEYICQACGQKKANPAFVYQCSKCGKILCDSCRGGGFSCKDSPKGTPGCWGTLKSKSST